MSLVFIVQGNIFSFENRHRGSKLESEEDYSGLNSYASPRDLTSIVRPIMNDKIVEMKLSMFQLIIFHQFSGIDHEDSHTHFYTFYELCGSVAVTETKEDALF